MKPKTRLRNEALPVTATQTIASKKVEDEEDHDAPPEDRMQVGGGIKEVGGGKLRQAQQRLRKIRTRRQAWSAAAAQPRLPGRGDLVPQQHQARFSFDVAGRQ